MRLRELVPQDSADEPVPVWAIFVADPAIKPIGEAGDGFEVTAYMMQP